ncbi:hypothetical protein NE237_022338 [Protea cynaroides]|uniref:Uncharacterized protein n=1 Tax=Protea cynaroides TaxID=273540 RepID=A0A9Q0HAU8_9MAGN|nr:hypothetical protein NE237_022338 [Protea cynaroides]
MMPTTIDDSSNGRSSNSILRVLSLRNCSSANLEEMETSLRYGGDSKAIRIHAKENFPIATNKQFQVHTALDTGSGDLSYFSGIIKNVYPELSTTLGVGLQYDKQDKFRYTVRGKTKYPVTTDGPLSFIIKGRVDAHKELKEKKPRGAVELSWSILNFQKDQDVRFKVGYEVFNKVPYLQIRENNWTLNADMKGRWDTRDTGDRDIGWYDMLLPQHYMEYSPAAARQWRCLGKISGLSSSLVSRVMMMMDRLWRWD